MLICFGSWSNGTPRNLLRISFLSGTAGTPFLFLAVCSAPSRRFTRAAFEPETAKPFSLQISRNECFIVIAVISSQKIKPGITLISWKPQFHNINWKQPCNSCNKIIQIVVRFFVDHRIKQHTSLLVSETV